MRVLGVGLLCGVLAAWSSPAGAQGPCRGDVNNDGVVNAADIATLSAVLFDPNSVDAPTVARADVNHDGAVGAADVVAVLLLNGFVCGSGPTPTPTPTPTASRVPTPTPTDTPPPTASQTSTPPPTASFTATDTVTPQAPTVTLTVTLTPTPSPTSTPTTSPTVTPTATATPSETATGPTLTPTFIPHTCNLGPGSSATVSARQAVLSLPLSGSQVWRFGPLQPDSTRSIVILPGESHIGCASTSFISENVKICARLDPTTYCHGGPNDGLPCPPAACGAGSSCDITPGIGAVDCAAAGGSLSGCDSLVQIDHNTNQTSVGGAPNIGLPADPNCTNTFVDPSGAVLYSCLEGTGSACDGPTHTHLGACNSPTEQTLSGVSPAGGFRLHESIDLNFSLGADCSTPCPVDDTPLQDGEIQLTGDITSGQTKGVVWQVNNTEQIMGTTGTGNGAGICGMVTGGPTCPTTAAGAAMDLTSQGGDCLGPATNVPATVSGAALALTYPLIDIDPTIGDFIATLRLQCQ